MLEHFCVTDFESVREAPRRSLFFNNKVVHDDSRNIKCGKCSGVVEVDHGVPFRCKCGLWYLSYGNSMYVTNKYDELKNV